MGCKGQRRLANMRGLYYEFTIAIAHQTPTNRDFVDIWIAAHGGIVWNSAIGKQ
mgnify:CR=1 FL=1